MTLSTVAVQNVLILGASYGGARAARLLAEGLPQGYRAVVLERNSHANHLYVLPRYAVISGYEDKAFVPYTGLFGPPTSSSPHIIIHGTITRLERHRITYSPALYEQNGNDTEERTLEFAYAVYALGARLPAPIDLWGLNNVFDEPKLAAKSANLDSIKQDVCLVEVGTKRGGFTWLQKAQKRLASVRSVLVVGGGALGIQFATDLKDVYPSKSVTLLHSRERLLPKFAQGMHDEINRTMSDFGIMALLGQRLDLRTTFPENAEYNERGERIVRTISGRPVAADMILLCTGQYPNTDLVQKLAPDVVDQETGLIRVLPSLQLDWSRGANSNQAVLEDYGEDLSHIFAIGDAADAFGAIKAGHTAWFQGELAAKNILTLIESKSSRLEEYKPGSPGIKVSLGRRRYVIQSGVEKEVRMAEDGKDDLDAAGVWPFWGASYDKDKDK